MDGRKRVIIPRLPSWVPNWAQIRLSNPVPEDYDMLGGCGNGIHPYCASGTLKADFQFVETSDSSLFELRTKGVELGCVSIIGEDFYGRAADSIFMEAVSIVESLEELVIPVGQSTKEAILRTLAGDRYSLGALIQDPEPNLLERSRLRYTLGKRFMVLNGLISLGPRATRTGDCVFIIPGCHVPVVIRPKRLMAEKKIPCSEHENIERCSELSCLTTTQNHVINQWHQVIGRACKYIASTIVNALSQRTKCFLDVHGLIDGKCEKIILESGELLEELHLR
jgi:hypothetical protein